jgi:hypothetical protein
MIDGATKVRGFRKTWVRIGSPPLGALALFSSLAPAVEQEPAPHIEVRWTPASGCPSEEWFIRRIEAFLGSSKEEAATRDFSARAVVRREPDGFLGQLEWENSDGREQRQLSDPDCLVLADASAFVVASAIDPLVNYERAEPLSEFAVSKPAEANPAPEPPPPAREPEKPSPPLPKVEPSKSLAEATRVALGPKVEGRLGLLPESALLLGATGEVKSGRWRGAASLTASLPRDAELAATGSAVYFAAASTLEGCRFLVDGAVEVPGCVVLEGALTRGRGQQVSAPETAWLPWVALGVGTSLALPLSDSFAARLGTNTGWVPIRPRFLFNGKPVSEPPIWSVALALSLEQRFP